MGITLDKVKIFRKPDGKIFTVTFFTDAKLQGETDDQFIDRQTRFIKLKFPGLGQLDEFVKTKDEIRSVISNSIIKNKRALRCDKFGQLTIDENHKGKGFELKQKKDALRDKIKLSLNLTEDESKLIC